ncbi:MAG: hypothetical protein DI570_06655 [Phenylobacterium zucineum]|nr:MAG: hypothetical protein DI570_06655 [Phenylobacterium zucineum]
MTGVEMRTGRPELGEWRRVARLAFIYWLAMYVWTNTLNVIGGAGFYPAEALGDGLVAAIGAVISLGSYAAVRAVQGLPSHVRWVVRGAAVLAATGAYVGATYAIGLAGWITLPRMPWVLQQFAWQIAFWALPHALWLALSEILEQGRAGRERDARLSAALVTARDAEIRALQYQVNPHFLYNALNSISALVLEGRPREADRMIVRLAGYYRANLQADPLEHVRLADELAQQEMYLEVERARFEDRLRVVVEVGQGLADALVPALILQPLVENAIKHGVNDPGEVTLISVTATRVDDDLVVTVRDNGPGGRQAGGAGVGLQNIRGRLAAMYGSAASLETKADGAGFIAAIRLPLSAQGAA